MQEGNCIMGLNQPYIKRMIALYHHCRIHPCNIQL